METIVCEGARVCAFFRGLRGGCLESVEWDTEPGPVPTWWGGLLHVKKGDTLTFFPVPGGIAFEGVVADSENHSESG